MTARVFVQPCRLDGHRNLRCGGAQGFDLTPVRPALVRTVVADFQGAHRDAREVRAERQEDPDQVRVASALEHLAGERERSLVPRGPAIILSFRLADEARGDVSHLRAVAPHDRDVEPGRGFGDGAADDVAAVRLDPRRKRTDDCRLPGARDIHEDVIGGKFAFLFERPSGHALLS